jgi:hypothetical protein
VVYEEDGIESKVTCRTFRGDWRRADQVRGRFEELIASLPNGRPVREQIAERLEPLCDGGRPYLILRFLDD